MLNKYNKDLKYILACSGGPDSMALLDMLIKEKFNIIVCMVNYKTRVESDFEETLVKEYCLKNNIKCYVSICPKITKGNFEDEARKYRYNFFKEIYEKENASGLFVAHHKDDLLETYLLKKKRNVINESYLINEKTIINKMNVYRPLLKDYYKSDLLEYCNINKVPYGIDSSNFLDIHQRNIIRKKLATMDKDEVYKKAIEEENKLKNTRKEVKDFIKFYPVYEVLKLKEKDETWLRIFIYEAVTSKYKKYINKALFLTLIDFINSEKPNLSYNIKDNYFLIKNYGKIEFCNVINKEFSYKFDHLEYIKTKDFRIVDHGLKMQGIYVSDDEFPIEIRNYHKDDVIKLKEGVKKVSRLFIDKKVPKQDRDSTIVIINNNGEVIFVYGLYRKYGLKYVNNNLFILK